jgi:hypothetical protein
MKSLRCELCIYSVRRGCVIRVHSRYIQFTKGPGKLVGYVREQGNGIERRGVINDCIAGPVVCTQARL